MSTHSNEYQTSRKSNKSEMFTKLSQSPKILLELFKHIQTERQNNKMNKTKLEKEKHKPNLGNN